MEETNLVVRRRQRGNPCLRAIAPLLLLLAGCRSSGKERALREIDESRHQLAALAPYAGDGLGRQSVSLAREALLEAETEVRRAPWTDAVFRKDPEWRAGVERALASVRIAVFVVEREREGERNEARAWLDSANGVLRSTRRSTLIGVHYQVQTRLHTAEQALAEAERLFREARFAMASEKAQEAVALAGELPPETQALFERFGDPKNRGEWSRWVQAAIEESKGNGKPALVVDKHAQLAVLWKKGRPARWLDVELGYNGLNRKLRAGDGATPEGSYRVLRRKGAGETRYYKALLLDYPNEDDRKRFARAKARGEIGQSSSIGGLIEIHGEGGRGANWTDGCVAVTNGDMDRLFDELKVGSPVVIVGRYDGIRVEGAGN